MTRQIVNKEVSVNESPEVNTFQSDKNGGDMESRPSLAEGNVAGGPVVEHPEAPEVLYLCMMIRFCWMPDVFIGRNDLINFSFPFL